LRRRVFGGRDLDLLDVTAAFGPAGAVLDPLADDLVLPGIPAEADAAGVIDLAGRLEQEQAAVGVVDVDAPAGAVAGDAEVVALRLEAEQGQAKSALALERAVARAHVATRAAENAHDMPLEIDLVDALAARHDDGGGGRPLRDIHHRQPNAQRQGSGNFHA